MSDVRKSFVLALMMGLALSGIVGAFVLTLAAIPSGASAFTFTTIDVPGATFTIAIGINARSQIVGHYRDASGTEHGFLLDKSTFTTIDVPGATSTNAFGINARGQIVVITWTPAAPSMVL